MARNGGVKFKRFNLVRRITRETFVNGYRNFAEYMYIESEKENNIVINWTALDGAIGYNIYRSENSEGEYLQIGSLIIDDQSKYTYCDFSAEKKLLYRVCPFDFNGEIDEQSVIIEGKWEKKTGGIISWPVLDGAMGYNIYRSENSEGEYLQIGSLITDDQSKYTYSDFSAEKKLFYRVCPFDFNGEIDEQSVIIEGKWEKKTGYSDRAYRDNLLIARGCLENHMVCPTDETKSIAYDEMRIINNPFYRLLKANVMKAEEQYFYFALMDMLRQYPFLSIDEIKDIYGKEYGCYKDSTIRRRLKEYADLGLLVWRRERRKDMYGIAPLRPYDGSYSGDQVGIERGICRCHSKLLRAVSFFSEASPLGIVGSQILDACNVEQKIFSFKNSFISQALDSIVLSDILEAIQQQQAIEVRAEQTRDGVVAVSNVLPICVLSSAWDGRQYVFVYDTEGKRYKSQRLDYIHSVAPCKSNSVVDINDIIDKSREVLRTMWAGNYLKYETPSHVVIDFAFDSEKEKHINQRIERECREPLMVSSYVRTGERKVEGAVCHPLELVPWILSYTGYIDNFLVEGTKKQREVLDRVCEHIQNLYRRYHYGSGFVYKFLEKYSPITKGYLEKWDTGEDNSPIFSEINSYYTVSLNNIFKVFCGSKIMNYDEVNSVIDEINQNSGFKDAAQDISPARLFYNGMLSLNGIEGENPYLSICDEIKKKEKEQKSTVREFNALGRKLKQDGVHFISIFSEAKCRPFTAYELRWLCTILQDERIYLFLSQDEVECLKVALEAYGCSPLYTNDSFRYFDVYNDGDKYSDPIYREIFETICQAIEDGNSQLEVEYITENSSKKGTDAVSHRVVPVRLEYSKLDNKFKLIAYEIGEKTETKKGHRTIRNLQVFRLSRMTKVKCVQDGEVAPELLDYSAAVDVLDKPLEVIVYPFKNVLERFFIAFSAYRKSVEYDEASGVCHVKLWFVARDQKELYCKLRSFGQGIEVVSPSKVRKEHFVRRVDRQYWNLIKSGLINKCKEPITVKVYENTLSRDSFKKNFSHYQIDIEPESENNAYIARIWYAEGDEPYVRAELKAHEFDLDVIN